MSAALSPHITRARLQLMLRHPYLAAAVARLPLVVADHLDWCDTMATDGYYIYVRTSFCQALSGEELTFVFAHETLHCVLGHIDRRGERDREAWNIAVDYATNLLLVDAGMTMPKMALHSHAFKGMTAEEVYDRLPAAQQQAGGGLDSRADPGDFEGRAGERPAGLASRPDGAEKKQRAEGGFDRHIDPGDFEGWANRTAGFPSTEERRRLRKDLTSSMGSLLPGREAGCWGSEIDAASHATVPWQTLLAHFINGFQRSDYRLYPYNKKHIWRGLYLPSLGVPGPEHLVVAVDTSGSMDDGLLGQVLSELDRLRSVTECKLTLIQCDAEIQKTTEYEAFEKSLYEADAPHGRLTFYGRGGTDLKPPFEWVTRRMVTGAGAIDALIYLTDGYGDVPDKAPSFPVMWIMPEDARTEMPFGHVIRLSGAGRAVTAADGFP